MRKKRKEGEKGKNINMKLYKNLHDNYSKGISSAIRKYTKTNKSRAKIKSSITFLIKCRKFGIIPWFIENATKNINQIFNFGRQTCTLKTERLVRKLLG